MKFKDFSQLGETWEPLNIDSGIRNVERGEYIKAISIFEKIRDKSDIPNEKKYYIGEAYYETAKIKQKEGRYRESIELLRKTLEYWPIDSIIQKRIELLRSFIGKRVPQKVWVKGQEHVIYPKDLDKVEVDLFRKNMRIICGIDCKHPSGESPLYCAECKKLVKLPTTSLQKLENIESVYSVGIYRYMGDEKSAEDYTQIIRRFKKGGKGLGKYLAQLLADCLIKRTTYMDDIDLIVVVPVDPQRWRERGYNPPSVIAEEVSRILCVPFLDNVLIKRGAPHARDLKYYEVVNNFQVNYKQSKKVAGKRLLLIDDITTRGYTLSACGTRLKEMGAKSIKVVTLAQSETTYRASVQKMISASRLARWYQISSARYLGPVRFKILYERYGEEIERVFELSDEELLSNKGITKQTLAGLREQKDKFDECLGFMAEQLKLMEEHGGGIVTLDDPSYPRILKSSTVSHPILYYKGAIDKFKDYKKAIAIVGTRGPSDESLNIAKRTSAELSEKGWVIVSGMAKGIDSAAHMGALEVNGLTTAFLGCGPDIIYPPDAKDIYDEITKKGVVISEFHFGARVEDWKLKKRNKTMIGATLGAFVVQSSVKGGAMNAVIACKEQKKPVFTTLPPAEDKSFSGNRKIIDEYKGKVLDLKREPVQIERYLLET